MLYGNKIVILQYIGVLDYKPRSSSISKYIAA